MKVNHNVAVGELGQGIQAWSNPSCPLPASVRYDPVATADAVMQLVGAKLSSGVKTRFRRLMRLGFFEGAFRFLGEELEPPTFREAAWLEED